MGYYSVAVLYNDFANELAEAPDAGKRISDAISGYSIRDYRPDRVNFKYGSIISQDHADSAQVIVVGGYKGGVGHPIMEEKNDKFIDHWAFVQMINCLQRNGYRVTKKRKVNLKNE